MRIPDALAIELLKRSHEFSDEQIAELYDEALSARRPMQDLIVRHKLLSQAELSRLYAEELGLPYVELKSSSIRRDHLDHLGARLSKKYRVAVFDVVDGDVKLVALEDPGNSDLVNILKKEFGNNVRLHVASPESIEDVLKSYHSNINLVEALPDPEVKPSPKSTSLNLKAPISQTVSSMLEYAARNHASDVHIEPRQNFIVIRFRVDGKLVEVAKLPIRFQVELIEELKHLSHLSPVTNGSAYTAKFGFEFNNQAYSVKMIGLPVVDGEKIVLRLIDEVGQLPSLEQLGFWGVGLKDIEQASALSQGLVLVVGGKSSGKSTSLLSLVNTLKSAGQSVATVEENISSRLSGVAQTEVGRTNRLSKLDGLKVVLEQDTDIIMVDELRDEASLDLAVQAANSGHLILGSMHAESSAQAIARLTSMGMRPYLSAAAVKLVVTQKLVRRLCGNCREAYRPDVVSVKQIAKTFSFSPSNGFKHLHEVESMAKNDNLGESADSLDLSSTTTSIKRLFRAKKNGCQECNHTGYKGRIGLFEVLLVSENIQKQIASGVSESALTTHALREGMIELKLDGLVKALRGLTSIEEVI